jgi:hypothetical protein
MSKEGLRKRIERDPRLKKDFDFLIAKTGLKPEQLLTGLRLDCNLMKADRQTLLSNEKKEMWPISRNTLKRNIKNIRRAARQIETTNETEFSPAVTKNIGFNVFSLPEILRSYAGEVERKVNIWAPYWKRKKSRIPTLVALTRQHSLYERIRSSTGGYHQVRLLRLVNAAREVEGLPQIEQRTFTIWLNRLKKRRKETPSK